MISLKNWDNKTWLSSRRYINAFNFFLLKKKKLNKNSQILDIGCGRGKIFGALSRKLRLVNKPIGIDPIYHKDVDKNLDFRNEDVFKFFRSNSKKFDLIMIKQTLHFLSKDKRIKLMDICKKNLKKKGTLIILSLNPKKNQFPCFKLMKLKLNRSLEKDSKMLNSICNLLHNNKIDKFKFNVSLSKEKYVLMLKQRYISCLINLNKDQLNKGIIEIKNTYEKKINFKDTLISIKFTK